MKFKLQLSEYGTVANRADVIIEADSEEEAVTKAERMAYDHEIEFEQTFCAVDGWVYQVEDVELVKK